ncbi:hypothetical protein SALBM311S_07647 [Streptomyces alboniger]
MIIRRTANGDEPLPGCQKSVLIPTHDVSRVIRNWTALHDSLTAGKKTLNVLLFEPFLQVITSALAVGLVPPEALSHDRVHS